MTQVSFRFRKKKFVIFAHHTGEEIEAKVLRQTRRHVITTRRFLQRAVLQKPQKTHVLNQKLTNKEIR